MLAKITAFQKQENPLSIRRAWCKTILTTFFYITSYNSFAPSLRYILKDAIWQTVYMALDGLRGLVSCQLFTGHSQPEWVFRRRVA